MQTIALIPARMNSTRFPGKPLALLQGKPMIQHVYERTCEVQGLDQVMVVTPDLQIVEVIEGFGGLVRQTGPENATGTDAVAEVARNLTADIIVNVQGDLPYFHPSMVDGAIEELKFTHTADMATVCAPISDFAEWQNHNVVKVVTDRTGCALYFSRSPIPYRRVSFAARPHILGYRHIGVYVYRRQFLLAYPSLPRLSLELNEQLEQLRALEHGHKIIVSKTAHPTLEVDTPEDLRRAETLLTQWAA